MPTNSTNSVPRRLPSPTAIDNRKDGPTLRCMKEMGSKEGYTPLAPSQHKWQIVDGEPPLHRMWGWFVLHTTANGILSPFAVRADGTPATLKDIATDLDLDEGQVSNLFKEGQLKGLWERKNGRNLYFNGDVQVTKIAEANARRKVECTLNLSEAELLIIKGWPSETQDRFWKVWNAAQEHHRLDLKVAVAEKRRKHAEIDGNIRAAFPLPKKRVGSPKQLQLIELPDIVRAVMADVHSPTVHSTPAECTVGEETGENVSVQPAQPYCLQSKSKKEVPASSSSVLEQEADRLVSALMIDADAAVQLLLHSRKVEPALTWRQVLVLCEKKLHDVKPKHSVAGLLLSTVPGMARGAMLGWARGRAAYLEDQERMRGTFEPVHELTDEEVDAMFKPKEN